MVKMKLLHSGTSAIEKKGQPRSIVKSNDILPPDMQIGLSCSIVDAYQKKTGTALKESEKKESYFKRKIRFVNHAVRRGGSAAICGSVTGAGAGFLSALLANADTDGKVFATMFSMYAGMIIAGMVDGIASWRRGKKLASEQKEVAERAVETTYNLLLDGKITSETAQDNLIALIRAAKDKFGLKCPDKAVELLSSGNITSTNAESFLAEMVESQYDAYLLISGAKVRTALARTTLTRLIANGVEDPNEAHDLLEELHKESKEESNQVQ